MKTLTLIIKQKWFDLIMSGEKTSEYRELTPYNASRLSELDEDGYLTEDPDNEHAVIPIQYDKIRFYVGYHKDRDTALVEVKEVHSELVKDDEGRFIYSGDPKEDDFWVHQLLRYDLGKIIEKRHNHRYNGPI